MPEETEIKQILERIEKDSPWHNPQNKEWYLVDGALREVMAAEKHGLFEPPKIFFYLHARFFEGIFKNPTKYGILIIRGPRRIGKTSTLKYLIKRMVESGYSPECFVYLTLDSDELFVELDKKRFLRELVEEIIKKFKKPDLPLIIVLDEVTFYKGWARAIKNLVDAGTIGPGIGLINTGSYSLDLSSAKTELSGRFGPLGEELGGDLFFFPRRFIEVSESVLGDNFKTFVARNFGKFGRRMGILEYLAGFQSPADSIKYNYEGLLNRLITNHYEDLHALFTNIYLYTGGYPRAIYEAVVSQKSGSVTISDARYRDDVYNLILTDSNKFGLDEAVVKNILGNMAYPTMVTSENYETICPNYLGKKDICEKYIPYLEASGLFNFLPNISSPEQIKMEQKIVIPIGNKPKLVISDPAAFISAYFCSRGSSSIFKAAKELTSNGIVLGHLAESIVVSHLKHAPVLKRSSLTANLGYVLLKENQEETELVDGMAWYINFKNRFVLLPVEVKYGNTLNRQEIEEKARVLKEKFGLPRLIVAANTNTFEVKENYVVLPIEILLSFL